MEILYYSLMKFIQLLAGAAEGAIDASNILKPLLGKRRNTVNWCYNIGRI